MLAGFVGAFNSCAAIGFQQPNVSSLLLAEAALIMLRFLSEPSLNEGSHNRAKTKCGQ